MTFHVISKPILDVYSAFQMEGVVQRFCSNLKDLFQKGINYLQEFLYCPDFNIPINTEVNGMYLWFLCGRVLNAVINLESTMC